VRLAAVAQDELTRVVAFLAHIRVCAAKLALGVNFVPGTPNLARVVEMQALSEALLCAYPELTAPELAPPLERAAFLPWPDHEHGGQPGHGWCAATAPQSVTPPDVWASTRAILARRPKSAGARRTCAAQGGAEAPLVRPHTNGACMLGEATEAPCKLRMPAWHGEAHARPQSERRPARHSARPDSVDAHTRKPARHQAARPESLQLAPLTAHAAVGRVGFSKALPRMVYSDVDIAF